MTEKTLKTLKIDLSLKALLPKNPKIIPGDTIPITNKRLKQNIKNFYEWFNNQQKAK